METCPRTPVRRTQQTYDIWISPPPPPQSKICSAIPGEYFNNWHYSLLTCLVYKFIFNLSINWILAIFIFVYSSHLTNNFAVTDVRALSYKKMTMSFSLHVTVKVFKVMKTNEEWKIIVQRTSLAVKKNIFWVNEGVLSLTFSSSTITVKFLEEKRYLCVLW